MPKIPARTVAALEARQRELAYLGRFDQRMGQAASLTHPLSGRPVRLPPLDTCHFQRDQAGRCMEILSVSFLEPEQRGRIPLNASSRYIIPPAGRGEKGLCLEATVFSHLEPHLRQGSDSRPATVADLLPLIQERAQEAEQAEFALAAGLASTSGWDRGAVAYIAAAGGDAFTHPLLLPYLVDLHDLTFHYHPLDPRMPRLAALFAPRLPAEEAAWVRERVKAMLGDSLQGHLTLEQVCEALEVSEETALLALRTMSQDKQRRYVLQDIPGLGWTISLQ